MTLTRRTLLAGLAASLPALAEARVETSFRPRRRGDAFRPASADGILAESGLGAITGFALRDLSNGRMLEEHRSGAALPPASVTKAVTALYGLTALGPDYRFRTQVAASGPVRDGRVQGDLYLIGGGDPHLDTDGLAGLAEAVAEAGVHGVTGRAHVVHGALPYHRSIDPGQPEYVGYNPAISGINLNFNRVHFEWRPTGGNYRLSLTARGTRFDPPVQSVEMRVSDGQGPTFHYRMAEGRDLWSVRRGALGNGGARWLPVRAPEIYAAEVFRIVGHQYNLRLPDLIPVAAAPPGLTVLAETASAGYRAMATAMLKYSTNLTAEVLGLRARQMAGGAPETIAQSSGAMTDWIRRSYGLTGARFVNHSGLTDETRVTPAEMVRLLDGAAASPLEGMLKEMPILGREGARLNDPGGRVRAKTGTLNFTRALAGYIDGANGRRLAFAIFAADLEARAAATGERPRGSRSWTGVAKRQEMDLLRRWAQLYGR